MTQIKLTHLAGVGMRQFLGWQRSLKNTYFKLEQCLLDMSLN